MGDRLRWPLPSVFALMVWASVHPLNLGSLRYLSLVPLLLYALVAFVNAAIVDPRRGVKLAAVAAVVLSVIYGAIRVQTMTLTDGPKIAVVQPNIPQTLKNESVDKAAQADENYRKHMELTWKAV